VEWLINWSWWTLNVGIVLLFIGITFMFLMRLGGVRDASDLPPWLEIIHAFILLGLFIGFIAVSISGIGLIIMNLSFPVSEIVKGSQLEGTLPFYIAGVVGFGLLWVAVSLKDKTIGALVAALGVGMVATAFGHWIGVINIPK
jgi:hypothetical protein